MRVPGIFRACVLTLWLAAPAYAEGVAVVAALDGDVEIGREDAWRGADLGATLEVGDALRTRDGYARLLVRIGTGDSEVGSVLTVGTDSQVVIEKAFFSPNPGPRLSYQVVVGTARWVGDKWPVVRPVLAKGLTEFPHGVEAIAGSVLAWVTGTDFILEYDRELEVVTVVTIRGEVTVQRRGDPEARRMIVRAGEMTAVALDRFPLRSPAVEPAALRSWVQPLVFVGQGRVESLSRPLLDGTESIPLPPQSLPAVSERIPGTTWREDTDPNFGQPIDVLEATTGDLEIPFD